MEGTVIESTSLSDDKNNGVFWFLLPKLEMAAV